MKKIITLVILLFLSFSISFPQTKIGGRSAVGGLSNAGKISILNESLVAFWKLDEASGNRIDATGRGNTLSDINTVAQVAGKIGNAAQFVTANAEALSINDNADVSSGDVTFTVAAWVWLDTKTADQFIVAKGSNTGSNMEYTVFYNSSLDRLRFGVNHFAGLVNADNFGTVATGQWNLVVAWHNATANTVNIQINNGTVNSVSYSGGITDGTLTFRLGNDGISSLPCNCRIDASGIWKKELTSDERTELWNSGNGRECCPF